MNKTYLIFICIISFIAMILINSHTIFPKMDSDEYFIDDINVIHNSACPHKAVPWFSIKHSKYLFLKEPNQEFCSTCFFSEEITKLMMLHHNNLKQEILRLERCGAPDDYIDMKIQHYEKK